MPLTPSPGPVWDQRPCHGLRDAYRDTVQPLPMCQSCTRWLQSTPLIPVIVPRAEVAGIRPLLLCRDRVEG